jgi:hypothetical protein
MVQGERIHISQAGKTANLIRLWDWASFALCRLAPSACALCAIEGTMKRVPTKQKRSALVRRKLGRPMRGAITLS